MNFFNDRELALRFKNNAVSSKERFWYLMINNILVILILLTPAINMYSASITGLSTIIGTILCYNTNKAGDDKEFIEIYICIGIPVMIRMLVYTNFFTLLIEILIRLSVFKEMVNESNPELILGIISLFYYYWIFYYYWRLNSSIRIAAN